MIETEDIRLSQERLNALKELITPIKDLAKNWNVDINSELEKYMLSFETDVNADNFAEAALVIQGSAGVWSKKVEFLYSLAVDSLGMLEEKQKKNNNSGGCDGENESEDEMMVLAPVVIKKSSNILVDLNSLSQTKHFKPKIPLCLSSISTKNDCIENLLYNKKGELLATRDDFTINRCLINKSGLLSLDIQTFYLLNKTKNKAMTPFYKRRVSQFDGHVDDQEVPHDNNKARAAEENVNAEAELALYNQLSEIPDNNLAESAVQHQMLDDDDDPGGALDLSDEPEDIVVNQDENYCEPKTPKHNMQTRSQLIAQQLGPKQVPSVISKIDQPLNPYEEVPNKPFKKAIIDKPKMNRKRKKSGAPKTSLSEVLKSSNKGSNKSVKFHNILRKPFYPENLELFKKLEAKDKCANKNIKKKLASKPQNIPLPTDLLKPPINPCADDSDDADGGVHEDSDGDFQGTITATVADDILQSHLENLETSQRESLQPHDIQLSYEDIVKQHVQKYTSEARHHFHVSELRERVLEWENKITPILDEEEQIKPFDVCFYSNKLIEKLSSCKDESADFKNLVSGEGKGEVCRLFLTSLMLTNSGNIEMKGDDNDAKCKLVSKKLFSHVLEGYVASSVESTRKRKTGSS